MEVRLSKKSIICFKKVYETNLNREETAESVVPDTQPDIIEIIDTDGMALLRSKDVEQGRAGLSGNISASVIYVPDGESGVRKLNVAIPFTAYAESPLITEETRCAATVRLCAIDARLLNPRKVLIRAEVIITIACYEEGELEIYDSLEEPTDAQVLLSGCRLSPVTDVREKTFVINDEYQLPVTKPMLGELLKQRVDIVVDDIKSVGNKLIFKGAVQVCLVYAGADDGQMASATFSSSFSQILEMTEISEQPDAQVSVMMTGVYFEPQPDGRAVTCELHLVAQAVTSDNAEVSYIADAYSNTYELRLDAAVVETMSIERRVSVRETIRETIETPSPVKETVHVYPIMGLTEVSGGKVRCPVTVTIIYRDEMDMLRVIRKVFTLESSVEIESSMEVSITDIRSVETFASATAGGLELRMPVDIDLLITEKHKRNTIVGIELDEESPIDMVQWPSVTVLTFGDAPDIWKLAKRYRSTPELIEAANELGEGTAGGLLLIPRAR